MYSHVFMVPLAATFIDSLEGKAMRGAIWNFIFFLFFTEFPRRSKRPSAYDRIAVLAAAVEDIRLYIVYQV